MFAATLLLFSLQLVGVGRSHASEAIESGKSLAGQAAAGRQVASSDSPVESSSKDSGSAFSQGEVHCLALNIYFEARSEPQSGQRAVGHVVMNRVAHSGYPNSVCAVVRQGGEKVLHRCQFSWWCDGQSDRPVNRKAWCRALRLARKIYLGVLEDTTGGALWYHATYVKPYWSELLLKGDKIGQHIFYLEDRTSSGRL